MEVDPIPVEEVTIEAPDTINEAPEVVSIEEAPRQEVTIITPEAPSDSPLLVSIHEAVSKLLAASEGDAEWKQKLLALMEARPIVASDPEPEREAIPDPPATPSGTVAVEVSEPAIPKKGSRRGKTFRFR